MVHRNRGKSSFREVIEYRKSVKIEHQTYVVGVIKLGLKVYAVTGSRKVGQCEETGLNSPEGAHFLLVGSHFFKYLRTLDSTTAAALYLGIARMIFTATSEPVVSSVALTTRPKVPWPSLLTT